MPKLANAQHELFCLEYVKDLNASRAYRDSGYKGKGAGQSAHTLLKKPEVSARVQELYEERAERVQEDGDEVLRMLWRNTRRAMQEEPVTDHEGLPTGEYKYEGAVANGALKLLGQHHGLFETKVSLSGEVTTKHVEVRDKDHAVELMVEQIELMTGKRVRLE